MRGFVLPLIASLICICNSKSIIEGLQEIFTDDEYRLQIIKPTGQVNPKLPRRGSKITAHYEAYVKETGNLFDSSKKRERPFTFTLGAEPRQVIECWEKAM
jgi:FKBP-type peptidyl-prolyl cis-trans isomerase